MTGSTNCWKNEAAGEEKYQIWAVKYQNTILMQKNKKDTKLVQKIWNFCRKAEKYKIGAERQTNTQLVQKITKLLQRSTKNVSPGNFFLPLEQLHFVFWLSLSHCSHSWSIFGAVRGEAGRGEGGFMWSSADLSLIPMLGGVLWSWAQFGSAHQCLQTAAQLQVCESETRVNRTAAFVFANLKSAKKEELTLGHSSISKNPRGTELGRHCQTKPGHPSDSSAPISPDKCQISNDLKTSVKPQ